MEGGAERGEDAGGGQSARRVELVVGGVVARLRVGFVELTRGGFCELGGRRRKGWEGKGGGYPELIALVLVRDEVGAREGDVVGKSGVVAEDVIAVAEHVRLKVAAAFFKGIH